MTKEANSYDELNIKYCKLQSKYKATNKGLIKVLKRSKKWKDRYYKQSHKNKQLIKYLENIIKYVESEPKISKEIVDNIKSIVGVAI